MIQGPDSAAKSVPPTRVGAYRILEAIGRGGMGVVYLAEHMTTAERVALKTVRVADQHMLSSIRREIHALRRIDHPGVVRIVAEGLAEGVPWYAMELLEGRTLRDHHASPTARTSGVLTTRVKSDIPDNPAGVTRELHESGSLHQEGSIPPPRFTQAAGGALSATLSLLRQVCETLAFVHGMGLVHRDLKPDNVFIRETGVPVLVDFGLALTASGAKARDVLDVSGRPMGSPAYMSPEQIRGDLVDARADLYALGCILYESVTGRVPFDGSVVMVVSHHLHDDPEPPSNLVEGVPPALEALILRLLQKRPQDRVGYAGDVAAALAELGAEAQVGWPRARPYLYRPELAGRHGPLATVERKLARVDARKGARIWVGGESGVGKTRFAMEVATLATRRGMRVIAGECDALKAAPLRPFRQLLLAVADRCRERGEAETERLLGDRGPVLADYEPSFARLPGQERYPELPVLQAQAARARLVSALAATLVAFAVVEPILLVLDDLQWADELSLAFLRALDSQWLARTPVILLGTYRSEEISSGLRELTTMPDTLAIELGRLGVDDVGQMISDMLAMPEPPTGFVGFLVEQSEGNPFFIAEYLRVAIDERVLYRNEAGAWRVAAECATPGAYREALPLPRELRALVGRRVTALSPGARAVARVASVLGREFEADILTAATTLDELPSLEAVEELRARQILDVVGGRLRFAHDKLREIIFSEIPDPESRTLAGVAARTIESRYAGTPEIANYYPILAHHFSAAGQDDKALTYLERAGEQALETGASAEALGFFRRILELDDVRRSRGDEPATPLQRASWERRLAQAEFNLGHMREAERYTREALSRLRTGRGVSLDKSNLAAAVVVLLVHLARQMYHLFGPASRVVKDPEERRRLTEASLAAERLSEIYFFQAEPMQSFSAALQSANFAEPLGPSPELARSYATLCIAFGLVPLQHVVEAYENRARAAAEAVGDPQAVSWVFFLLTLSAIGTARWDMARASNERAIELARVAQDHRRLEECLAFRGNIDLMTGAFGASENCYDELLESSKKSGNHQGEIWALCGGAEAMMAQGRTDDALERMERAHLVMKDDTIDESTRITQGEVSFVHLMRGDRERARRIASDTLERMERISPSAFHLLNGYVATCEVFLKLYEDERDPGARRVLARAAQRACRAMRRYARNFPIGRPVSHRCDGLLHAIAGRPGRALRCFEDSLVEAERLRMPLEAALARYEAARLLPASNPARTLGLFQARSDFASLGARYWLACVEAELHAATQPALPAFPS